MLCSICKEKPAVVFVAKDPEGSTAQGLCLSCAKEMGVKPICGIMKQMGLPKEDMEGVVDQLNQAAENITPETLAEVAQNLSAVGTSNSPFSMFPQLFPNQGFSSEESMDPDSKNFNKAKKKFSKRMKRKFLDIYCQNLNEKAKKHELDIVVKRENELNRVIQILCRRTKNNPCLIGEPGVGKTAIAECLAMRIIEGKIHAKMKNKEIYLVDLTALIAGTQFRGQFESRIKGLVDEVESIGNIILFIDEIHNLVGSGDSNGEGSPMNAANILKPALSRGRIQVIGATTFKEHRKYIEKDSALERRFQPVTIREPSVKDTCEIIESIKHYYERFHFVIVNKKIISTIVNLSERYITDRFLPDKAIDLLDESCAYTSLKNKDMCELENIKFEIEKLKLQEKTLIEQGVVSTDQEKFKKLANISQQLSKLEEERNKFAKNSEILPEVSLDDVSKVVEIWTGIKSAKIQQSELEKFKNLEEILSKKVIGQEEAIKILSVSIRRNRAKIAPRRRPVSFIFVGPTGVGKTELVKVLAKELFDRPDSLIRFDMSEFMEKHSVSRMSGSPPGYVGHDEAGQLTEKVRHQPYSVLLLDEIEKAHPDIMNILLQILDEGKTTDSHGRMVNFEDTVIIMTSNAGSENRENLLGFGKNKSQVTKEKAKKALEDFLKPEFLGRVDEIIVFNDLKLQDFKKISHILLKEYVESLRERKITLEYNEAAVEYLANKSFNKKSGAREVSNNIRHKIEDKIATAIIASGESLKKILLSSDENGLVVSFE
ncbi:MAG: ATP-dependent Clp protease ATP-binding subunit [Oscillospiraceae bacterium]|jgi:ATP-dependent Clp protease ATP-binding subunit ClpA|nr:ATP-dependent Clp protease ATP-binding subunit [Oscillospiraceae bacterium]